MFQLQQYIDCDMASVIQLHCQAQNHFGSVSVMPQTHTRSSRDQIAQNIQRLVWEVAGVSIIPQNNFNSKELAFSFSLVIFQRFELVFTLQIDLQRLMVYLKARIFHNQKLTFITSFEMYKFLTQKILSINLQASHLQFQVSIQQSTGLIFWKGQQNLMRRTSTLAFLLSFIKSYTRNSMQFAKYFSLHFTYLSNKITKEFYLQKLSSISMGQYEKEMAKMNQIAQLKQLLPFLTYDKNTKLETQKHFTSGSYPQMLGPKPTLNSTFCSDARILFALDEYETRGYAYNLLQNKESVFKELGFPTFVQKCTIMNEVVILENRQKEIQFTQGRRASLFFYDIKMKYLNGAESLQQDGKKFRGDMVQKSQALIHQFVIGKLPRKINDKVKMDNVGYEKLILLRLKNDNCAYFPQYYYTRQSNFAFSNYFLIEHIKKLPLHQETQLKHLTYTQRARLMLLTHISNAIRFLQTKNITHIDLSPNNILVVNDMKIKLIDFGESYCPQITENYLTQKTTKDFKYCPGKTFPYTAPEVAIRSSHFTSQQDIFSLGVICFKLLFGTSLFRFGQKTIEKIYKEKSYLDRLYVAPQAAQDLGTLDVHELLMGLSLNLLSQEEGQRPTPSWAHLMLKKVFELSHF